MKKIITINSKIKVDNLTSPKINIRNHHKTLRNPISNKSFLRLINYFFVKHGIRDPEISVNLVNRTTIRKINRQFLKHDYSTDVLAFQYQDKKSLDAEIFLCLDEIKRNASKYSVSFSNEFKRVLIHACLHLCGYEDKTKYGKAKMREQENYFLKIVL